MEEDPVSLVKIGRGRLGDSGRWSRDRSGTVGMWARCTSGMGQTPQAISVTEETQPEEIAGLCEDAQGHIWVGTSTGRFRLDRGKSLYPS